VYAKREFAEHAKALTLISDFPKTNFRRGSGYVVDTFWTAIDCPEKSDSYLSAVKAAISYGNDTDTTSCVAGGLAGIKYGLDYNNYADNPTGIPDDWVSALIMPLESSRVIGCLR
jgi:ADP-ribosylglycohydrolase